MTATRWAAKAAPGRSHALVGGTIIPLGSLLVQRSPFVLPVASLAAFALPAIATRVSAQSELAVSPFVSFLPSSGPSPLAGVALMLGGRSSLALRASGNVSLQNLNRSGLAASNSFRPWGADADAVFLLARPFGGTRSFAPYGFAGIGMQRRQDAGFDTTTTNWSYGAGVSVPLAGPIDLFGESRWRMSRFVLPTAHNAPGPTNELSVGISLHFGG